MKSQRDAPDPSLYLAVVPVILSAPLCAGDRLEPVLGLLPFVTFMVAVGVPVSYRLRQRGANRVVLNRVVTFVTLALGIGLVLASGEVFRVFHPARVLDFSLDRWGLTYLIRAITWVIAFRCLTLLTDVDVLLSIGFSLSLFILVVLVEPEERVLAYLLPFAAGSLYLLIRHHRNALRRRCDERVSREAAAASWRHDFGTLAVLGAVVSLLAVSLSFLLSGIALPASLLEGSAVRLSEYLQRLHAAGLQGGLATSMEVSDTSGTSSPAVAFEVVTQRPGLWRGNVYNEFDGREWRIADERLVWPPQTGRGAFLVNEFIRPPQRPDAVVAHRFRTGRPRQSLLYGTVTTFMVIGRRFAVESTTAGRLSSDHELPSGTRYTVLAVTEPQRGVASNEPVPEDIRQRYLERRYRATPRVRGLARRLVSSAMTNAQKMEALENYLARSKWYTKRPAAIPDEVDTVDYFLFNMTAGWCRHFATALAVMGREVGVPTRLVDGYLPGELSDEGDRYIVRERDAHAWVEAWDPERGWLTYDVTELTVEQLPLLVRWLQSLRDGARLAHQRLVASGVQPLLLGAGLAALALAGVLRWRPPRRRARPTRRALASPAARRLERQLERAARRLGLARRPSETSLTVARRLAERAAGAAEPAWAVAETVSRLKFAGRALSAGELAAAWQAAGQLRRAVQEARRRG